MEIYRKLPNDLKKIIDRMLHEITFIDVIDEFYLKYIIPIPFFQEFNSDVDNLYIPLNRFNITHKHICYDTMYIFYLQNFFFGSNKYMKILKKKEGNIEYIYDY